MMKLSLSFFGVEPAGIRGMFTYALLDSQGVLIKIETGDMNEVLAEILGKETAIVAVNSSQKLNAGIVRAEKCDDVAIKSTQSRGVDMRKAEYELKEHGIHLTSTPSRMDLCPEWMHVGFTFFDKLNTMNFHPFPSDESDFQWLETNSHTTFCALLGRIPLPKPTLEGKLQRQVVLFECGLGIKDPMNFFEEITKHKLISGCLPLDLIYLSEEIDALAAAYVAYHATVQPENTMYIGNEQEGWITIPCARLLPNYSSILTTR